MRKSWALLQQAPRTYSRLASTSDDYLSSPPILVDSFPKSGTHLLLQILEALPERRNYGSFIASIPSVTFRERSKAQHMRLLGRIAPGEILCSHLHFAPEYERILQAKNCVHFFVYRDLRDVAISEAHYLNYMSMWHRLHPSYARLPDQNSRISYAILGAGDKGLPSRYPNIAERFRRYAGWLRSENVFAVKFEDLIGEQRDKTLHKIIAFFVRQLDQDVDMDRLVQAARDNINPKKSHTFRRGEQGQWKELFTEEHKKQIYQVAEDLLLELGYPGTYEHPPS